MQYPKHKNTLSQLQPNISLPESPIRPPSHQDSSQSPEPYFYPTSYQPKPQKIPRYCNLKLTVINLLSQLKQWLIELCLTETCISQVNELLQPIIEQLIEVGEQLEDSYWVEAFNMNKQLPLSLKESQNVQVSEGISEAGRHCSILFSDSRTEIALLGEGQKNLVKLFFKRYHRLFENALTRIKRFSGQKKLKFLVDTTVKNIFSQTLRVSYDLKLIEHKLKQQKQAKISLNFNGYIQLLADRITMILHDKGNIKLAFTKLKQQHIVGNKRDAVFVRGMMKNINKLCNLYERNKKWAKTHHLYNWREVTLQNKLAQEQQLISLAKKTAEGIIPGLAPTQNLEEFKVNWRQSIEQQLNSLINSMFAGDDCLFINMENIMPRTRLEKNASIVELLQEQELICPTHRTHPWKEHPFLNEFTVDQLKNCILSGEIYRSDRTSSSLLLIPVKPASGIIFASLVNQPYSSISFSKTPMSLKSFRTLLRLVELVTPLLEQVSQICKRLQQQWQQIDQSNHLQLLFKQFIKTDLQPCDSRRVKPQLQITQHRQECLQIDSYRLQSPDSVITNVMKKLSISNLMIYHINQENIIRDLPCIVYGNHDIAPTQKHIIQPIYNELLSTGKNILTVNRNNKTFTILPLKKNQQNIGLIHCITDKEINTDFSVVSECLVPLVMKHEGSIDCQECQVQLTIPEPKENMQEDSSQQKKITLQQSIKLVLAADINQLQHELKMILNDQGHYFQQMIFRLDLSDPQNYFFLKSESALQFLTLPQKQQISHSDIYLEQNLSMTAASTLAKLAFRFPCFPNPQVYIYQHENTSNFRLIALPIQKNNLVFGYWLVGHYLSPIKKQAQLVLEQLKTISKLLSSNKLFEGKRISQHSLGQELKKYTPEQIEQQQDICRKIENLNNKGKFRQQIQQLYEFACSVYPTSKCTIAKVTPNNQLIPILSDSSIKTAKALTLNTILAELLNTCDISISHQKLLSQICRVNKSNEHRTIRPMKSHQLQSTLIFLPPLPEKLKQQLISIIKQKHQLEGWISTDNLYPLSQLSSMITPQQKNNQAMLTLTHLGTYKEEKMYLLIETPFQHKQQHPISEPALTFIQSKCKSMLHLCQSQLQPSEKISAVSVLSSALQNDFTLAHCISQFKRNRLSLINKTTKFAFTLSKFLSPEKHKEQRYIRLMLNAFESIAKHNRAVKNKYKTFALQITSLLQNAEKITQLTQGFTYIFHSLQNPNCNQMKSCKILTNFFQRKINKLQYSIFSLLCRHSEFKTTKKHLCQTLSLQKLQQILNRIHTRKHQAHFFNQIHQFLSSFSYNLSLIAQEFPKLKFYTREQFLKFSNDRFKTLLSHFEFGLVSKISIMCGQRLSSSTIVYKMGQENVLEEHSQKSNPNSQSLQFDLQQITVPTSLNNNRHFLVLKTITKTKEKAIKEVTALRRVVEEGIAPCYRRYLDIVEYHADKLCTVLQRINCKQTWNNLCSQPQRIYAFSNDRCLEEQSAKLRAISTLKSLKQLQNITESKLISETISNQSKTLYNLQYEHNALSAILTGTQPTNSLSQQQAKVVSKYGEVVTRDQIIQTRQEVDLLQMQEQAKTLQYQIKSKTFATTKILTFLQHRSNNKIESTANLYLHKQNLHPNSSLQQAYVDSKLSLNQTKQKIKHLNKKLQHKAVRNMWLITSRAKRQQQKRELQDVFRILLLPKAPIIRINQ